MDSALVDDLILHIFTFLPLPTVLFARRLSRRWKALAETSISRFEHLFLHAGGPKPSRMPASLEVLFDCKSGNPSLCGAEDITIFDEKLNSEKLSAILSTLGTKVKRLTITHCELSNNSIFDNVSAWPFRASLQVFRVTCCSFSDFNDVIVSNSLLVPVASHCPNLKEFIVRELPGLHSAIFSSIGEEYPHLAKSLSLTSQHLTAEQGDVIGRIEYLIRDLRIPVEYPAVSNSILQAVQFYSKREHTDLLNKVLNFTVKYGGLDINKPLPASFETTDVPLLHNAVVRGQIEVAEVLLERGASPIVTDSLQRTAFHMAILGTAPLPCLQLLCNKVISSFPSSSAFLVDALNIAEASHGFTPLHLAAIRSSSESIQLLLEHGANPLVADKEGRVALHHAACCLFQQNVEVLLRIGKTPVDVRDKKGCSPLHLAVALSRPLRGAVTTLLADGGSLLAEDEVGINPLDIVQRKGHYEVLEWALEILVNSVPKEEQRTAEFRSTWPSEKRLKYLLEMRDNLHNIAYQYNQNDEEEAKEEEERQRKQNMMRVTGAYMDSITINQVDLHPRPQSRPAKFTAKLKLKLLMFFASCCGPRQ